MVSWYILRCYLGMDFEKKKTFPTMESIIQNLNQTKKGIVHVWFNHGACNKNNIYHVVP